MWPRALSHMLALALDRLLVVQQVQKSRRLTPSSIIPSGKPVVLSLEPDIDLSALLILRAALWSRRRQAVPGSLFLRPGN